MTLHSKILHVEQWFEDLVLIPNIIHINQRCSFSMYWSGKSSNSTSLHTSLKNQGTRQIYVLILEIKVLDRFMY